MSDSFELDGRAIPGVAMDVIRKLVVSQNCIVGQRRQVA